MITKISLGKGPMLYFGFMGGTILIADLVGPRTLGELQPILHTMDCCKASLSDMVYVCIVGTNI